MQRARWDGAAHDECNTHACTHCFLDLGGILKSARHFCGWKKLSRQRCAVPQVCGGAKVVMSTPLHRNFSLMDSHNSLSNTVVIIGKSSIV